MIKTAHWGLRILVNPFYRLKPLKFQSHLKEARSILIFFNQPVQEISKIPEALQILDLLKNKKIRIIDTGSDNKKADALSVPVTYLSMKKINLWQVLWSTQLKWLSSETYDVFMDLSQTTSLLSVYLGYKIQSPLKIAMGKSDIRHCFHLQYQPANTEKYSRQLTGFTRFIEKMGV